MNFLLRRKYDLIGIGVIGLLFFISIYVRSENLKAPLSRHHEWITAHALLTAEIWDQNGGPSAYGFNPVYTYKGEGNSRNRMLGGITDSIGDTYYVSYPPFAYIYLYYSSQLVGGPSLFSARFSALSLHIITAWLIYFLIGSIRPPTEKKRFNFAGIIAAGLYIFAQGNLWFHGNLFFSDMVVQPLFIGGLLSAVHYFKGNYKNEKLILFGLFLLFFISTYTEWLGLFSAFFTGVFFLIMAIVKKRKQLLKPFFVIGIGSALALGLTISQYSSIDGWDAYKATSEKKYAERSGHNSVNPNDVKFTMFHEESFSNMKQTFNSYYKSIENYVGFAFGITVLLILLRLTKKLKMSAHSDNLKWGTALVTLIILPIVLHYLLFYNFNAMHYFSGLKTSIIIVVLAGILVQMSMRIATHTHAYLVFSLMTFFAILLGIKSNSAIKRYTEDHILKMIDYDRITSAKAMKLNGNPDEIIFMNVRLSPEQVFYAKHNPMPVNDNDTLTMLTLMKLRKNLKAQYYHHEGSKLKSMTRIELHDDNLVFLDTLIFN